ncbi:hypothetical protein D3C76_1223160 [compost metagenome]
MNDAAVDRLDAGQDAFVERSGQGRQLALQFVERCASCADVSLQVPHGVTRDFVVEAVEHDQDDVVFHGGKHSGKRELEIYSVHCGSGLAREGGQTFDIDVD